MLLLTETESTLTLRNSQTIGVLEMTITVQNIQAAVEHLGIEEGDVVEVVGPNGKRMQARVVAILETAIILGPA